MKNIRPKPRRPSGKSLIDVLAVFHLAMSIRKPPTVVDQYSLWPACPALGLAGRACGYCRHLGRQDHVGSASHAGLAEQCPRPTRSWSARRDRRQCLCPRKRHSCQDRRTSVRPRDQDAASRPHRESSSALAPPAGSRRGLRPNLSHRGCRPPYCRD